MKRPIANVHIETSAGLSAAGAIFPGDEFIGELNSCFGVDVHLPALAPIGERGRIDIHLLDDSSLSDFMLNQILRLVKPLVVPAG